MRDRRWRLASFVVLLCLRICWCQESATHSVSASAYLPMDSYAYSLIDRLAAEGVIETQFLGQKPWTREQCARLIHGAQTKSDFQAEILEQLRRDFKDELEDSKSPRDFFDEVYVRSITVADEPLTDYHFGPTIYNDNGRPILQGENLIVGLRGTRAWKKIILRVQGEYQHAAAPMALSIQQQNTLNSIDELPAGTARYSASSDRIRLVEAYVGTRVKNVNVTVGKQALWWGPSPNSAMLYSTNAEPIYMLRIQQDAAIRLPWVLRYLGPMRWDSFFGKLEGHRFPFDPYLHGQKISLKPTPNLELGFSRTVVFAGAGRGLTFGSFWHSFASVGDKANSTPGSSQDVGDRRGGFDFNYRIPGVRDRITLYGDFFTDDDPSPLASPRRSAMQPGIYISRLPFTERVDLRVEAIVTDQGATSGYRGRFFYFNGGYRDGYTNNGQILGSWVGRDAKAVVANSRYWFSATKDLSVMYKNVKTDSGYLPGGGTQHDLRITMRTIAREHLRIEAFVQYEQWKIPLLAPQTSRNLAVGFWLGYLRH